MESRLAARTTLTLALPLAITAGHENGRNHDLRVQSRRQRRLNALHETLSEGRRDLRAQLRIDGAVCSQERASLGRESIVEGQDRRRGRPLLEPGRPPDVSQFSRIPTPTRTALWRAVIAPPSSRTTRRLSAHLPSERPLVATSTTKGTKNMTEAITPMRNTRTREAESFDQVRAALMSTRRAAPRYVVPSMTAAAKR